VVHRRIPVCPLRPAIVCHLTTFKRKIAGFGHLLDPLPVGGNRALRWFEDAGGLDEGGGQAAQVAAAVCKRAQIHAHQTMIRQNRIDHGRAAAWQGSHGFRLGPESAFSQISIVNRMLTAHGRLEHQLIHVLDFQSGIVVQVLRDDGLKRRFQG